MSADSHLTPRSRSSRTPRRRGHALSGRVAGCRRQAPGHDLRPRGPGPARHLHRRGRHAPGVLHHRPERPRGRPRTGHGRAVEPATGRREPFWAGVGPPSRALRSTSITPDGTNLLPDQSRCDHPYPAPPLPGGRTRDGAVSTADHLRGERGSQLLPAERRRPDAVVEALGEGVGRAANPAGVEAARRAEDHRRRGPRSHPVAPARRRCDPLDGEKDLRQGGRPHPE